MMGIRHGLTVVVSLFAGLALAGCGLGGGGGKAPAKNPGAAAAVPWFSSDIGAVGQAGSESEAAGTFTINASGSDIWDSADSFRFYYTPLNGDGVLVARVSSLEQTDAWAKAGVMIRETLDAGSCFAMTVVTPTNGGGLQYRVQTGQGAGMAPTVPGAAPMWVKIERVGDLFTGSTSGDGSTWTSVGSISIPMGADVFIGLCVTAHNNSTLATAELDSLTYSGQAVGGGGTTPTGYAGLQPVPYHKVALNDNFWAPRITTNRTVSLPAKYQNFVDNHNLDNFAKAAGLMGGNHDGFLWADSDVHKTLEGMAYAIKLQPDLDLENKLEAVISNIAAAQVKTGPLAGYLNTYFQLGNAGRGAGGTTLTVQPWENLPVYHEDYVAGHLIEAAVAHYNATGRSTFLNVARKYADNMEATFGIGKRSGIPGHQEAELALMKLYRTVGTGTAGDFDLAKFYIDERGRYSGGRTVYGEYCQDLIQVRDSSEPMGHCVRGPYMWSGATDIAATNGETELVDAMERLWTNVVNRKMYVTGSIGHGNYNEGFGPDWDLSNEWAYNETCGSCAMMMWSLRLANLHADAKYVDVLERILYNGFASGRSIDGTRLYYNNHMVRTGAKNRFGIDCCATNIVRTVPSVPGYQYAVKPGAGIWTHLYIAGQANVVLDGGTVGLKQETTYPWDGAVKITVSLPSDRAFALNLRLPEWAGGASCSVNGSAVAMSPVKGYLPISRTWQNGDIVQLTLPMNVRRLAVNAKDTANLGRTGIARGPIVFCLESGDNSINVHRIVVPSGAALTASYDGSLLGGVTKVTGSGVNADNSTPVNFTMIPYGVWDNRAHDSSMTVMVPESIGAAVALPEQNRMSGATISYSYKNAGDNASALNDGVIPHGSNDGTIPRFTWWNHQGTAEWVQYDLPASTTIWRSDIFWYADADQGGGCDFPQSFIHEYWNGSSWQPLVYAQNYGGNDLYSGGHFTIVRFNPVTTTKVRLKVQLKAGKSGGILEWRLPE